MTNKAFFPVPLPTNRDILIFELAEEELLVVACDSAGAIGPKPLDKVKVDGYTLGKFTARTALMEVIAVGAKPICVVNTLSVEPEPTGKEILQGIRDEAEKAGLDPKLAVTGSTEKNVVAEQTGIGVTVIGTCSKAALKIGVSSPTDIVVALGVPCVGEEVIPAEKDGKIAETTDVCKLRNLKFIHDLVPVGSLGIARETRTLAESSKLQFEMLPQLEVDTKKSAGPATVVLASLPKQNLAHLKGCTNKTITVVAHLFT